MPIDTAVLDPIARRYVASMTSIRGRRVHRLLMREFARFDAVLACVAEDGTPGLLALADNGAAALCRSDGRGAAAELAAWSPLAGARVTTAYDLLKDSLPILGWTIWHPGFTPGPGALTITAADIPAADHDRIAALLRGLGGP